MKFYARRKGRSARGMAHVLSQWPTLIAARLSEPTRDRTPQTFPPPTLLHLRLFLLLPLSMCSLKNFLVSDSIRANLGVRKLIQPTDCVVFNPVMGLARQAPVANRWRDAHSIAVPFERPPAGLQRRDHLISTSAAAVMRRSRIFLRYVENSIAQYLGNSLDVYGLDTANFHGHQPLPVAQCVECQPELTP